MLLKDVSKYADVLACNTFSYGKLGLMTTGVINFEIAVDSLIENLISHKKKNSQKLVDFLSLFVSIYNKINKTQAMQKEKENTIILVAVGIGGPGSLFAAVAISRDSNEEKDTLIIEKESNIENQDDDFIVGEEKTK